MFELVFMYFFSTALGKIESNDFLHHKKYFSTLEACEVEKRGLMNTIDQSYMDYIISCRKVQK